MNILIETAHSPYSQDRVGGAETSLRLIAEKMAERGHTVFFITRQQTKTFFGYSRVNISGVVVLTYSKFKFSFLNRVKVKKIIQSFKARHQKSLIIRNEIRIIHTYYNFSLLCKYVQFKKELDFKLIIRIAGLKLFEEINSKGGEHKKQYIQLFNEVDSFNFISEGLFNLFHQKMEEFEFKFKFNNYFIKDIGVNIDERFFLKPVIKSKKKMNIVMVSRFSCYQKRQDILIEAMALLKNKNIHLTLIGEGPNKKKLSEHVELLGLKQFVSFLPFIKMDELWNNLNDFDLLVHACNYEGLSKIIIESMAYGLPVLVSNVSPLNTYIEEGYNGFLVQNDPESWSQKIQDLYGNQHLYPVVVKNAKSFISNNYNSDQNILVYQNHFLKF